MTWRVAETSRPRLPHHVKLRFDSVRERWVLLVPERVLLPNGSAADILRRCDGETSVAAIADQLAGAYSVPSSDIRSEVKELLQGLADKGFIEP